MADTPKLSKGTSTATKTGTATKTSTSTSTEAYTQGNVTVTGGAGDGHTNVFIGSPAGKKGGGMVKKTGLSKMHKGEKATPKNKLSRR